MYSHKKTGNHFKQLQFEDIKLCVLIFWFANFFINSFGMAHSFPETIGDVDVISDAEARTH